jgi:DNA-binding NtrC family response regulator
LGTKREKILIVDDERFIRMTLGEAVRSWNYAPIEAADISTAREVFANEEPDVVLLDIDLPDGSGLDLLDEIKETAPDTVVIMITGNISVPNTIAALRGGAHDFIGKPVRLEELRVTLRNAVEIKLLRREVTHTRHAQKTRFDFDQIIGESPAIVRAKDLAERVAVSDVNAILLQGETGTGKDLFARAIHYASERADAPYLAINCAALPANLIESELFGYEKGAFTDAKQRKEGLFEQAQGGTIFLDEIGEMELGLQAKLLRVLEESTFRRVGGLKDITFDARIIAASNKDLREEGEHGHFRLDLYYRLSVIQIDIPPLREREDDCLLLASFFIERSNPKRRGPKLVGLSAQTAEIFRRHAWKGNVREMRNVIERASILEDGDQISTTHLPADLLKEFGIGETAANQPFRLPAGGIALDEVEEILVRQAFEVAGGNLTRAAKLLHISRDQLRYKLKKSGNYQVDGQKNEE